MALGQFIVALVFAEVSSHFPLAGSVFQWTKLLSNSKPYAWFSGWIYLWAGALTVAAVVGDAAADADPDDQRHRASATCRPTA